MFTNIISSYTRKQAIEDGFLIDISKTAREAGIKFPVAVTNEVWQDCIDWDDKAAKRKKIHQDIEGRLWDVVYMASLAMRRAGSQSLISFQVYRVPYEGRGRKARPVTLVAQCGPGDDLEPVITIKAS